MIRKLKALGLAMVAVLALSAVAASAASAQQGKLTSDGPVTLDLTELAGKLNALTAFGGAIECPGSAETAHYTLTRLDTLVGQKHKVIVGPVESTTNTKHLNQANCKVVEGGTTHKATVTMNGCDTHVTLGSTVTTNRYAIGTDIGCPTEKDIQIDVYAFAASELGGIACTLTIKEQVGLTGPTITTDTVNDDLTIEGTFTGIKASKSGFGCASEETNAAEWHANYTVKGTNEAGGATGITVTD